MTLSTVILASTFVLSSTLLVGCGASTAGSAPGGSGNGGASGQGHAGGDVGGGNGEGGNNAVGGASSGGGDGNGGNKTVGGASSGGTDTGGSSSMAGGVSEGGEPSNGDDKCAAFAACGGNLVGRWKVTKLCPNDATLEDLEDSAKPCPDSTGMVTLSASGFYEFDPLGKLKVDTSFTAHFVESVPSSCLTGGKDCATLQDRLSTIQQVSAATCQATATGCDCVYDISGSTQEERSYVSGGSHYTETDPSTGIETTSDYCVKGASLRISDDGGISEFSNVSDMAKP